MNMNMHEYECAYEYACMSRGASVLVVRWLTTFARLSVPILFTMILTSELTSEFNVINSLEALGRDY